jgi:SAM-dependent methyltransferase
MLPLQHTDFIDHTDVATASPWSARVPLWQAALVQIGAVLLAVLAAFSFPVLGLTSGTGMRLALVQGGIAAVLGRAGGMDPWWLPIHALFVPALAWTLTFNLPPIYWLGAFCLLASLYWSVSQTRVPLFLSSHAATQAIVDLLPGERAFTFLDMGCGLGGVLARLVRARPLGSFYGIEAAPLPFLLSRLRSSFGTGSCRISWGDFGNLDLSRYDVVYAYLSPAAMNDVWRKASREMRPGSLLISNRFEIPGVPAVQTIATGRHSDSKLLIWRM